MKLLMKKDSTFFLRGTLVVIALAVAAICIFVLPQGLLTDKTGMFAPIIILMYATAVPFFIALHRSWKLLNLIDTKSAFAETSVIALKHIKYCAITISSLYLISLPYIFHVADLDDAPGVVAITLVIIFTSGVIATFAALLQKLLRNVIDIKSENELTV